MKGKEERRERGRVVLRVKGLAGKVGTWARAVLGRARSAHFGNRPFHSGVARCGHHQPHPVPRRRPANGSQLIWIHDGPSAGDPLQKGQPSRVSIV